MAKWFGNSIESFKKHFKHNVEIDGQVDINNTLNYDGEDSKYLVLNNNDVLSYRSIANLRTDVDAASVHATVQTGKNYRIVNCNFRADIGTDKYYLPLKSQDEQTVN